MVKSSSFYLMVTVGIGLMALVGMMSLMFGARTINPVYVVETLLQGTLGSIESAVVLERVPRTVFGMVAGMALGLSGAIMQAITRNPIADPSILGVNTGAALFVVTGISYFGISTAPSYIAFALAGSAVSAILVYSIGSIGAGGLTPIKLALAGAVTSAVLSSMVSMIVLPRTDVMNTFRFWQVGSISGATWESLQAVYPILAVGMVISIAVTPALNILALGEDMATGLGVNVGAVRFLGAVGGVILCGAVTALAGPIGFVGLAIPHLVRPFTGPDFRKIFLLSGIFGSSLLLAADIIGRLIGGSGEVEAGIVTAFIGAPVLIMIVGKSKVGQL